MHTRRAVGMSMIATFFAGVCELRTTPLFAVPRRSPTGCRWLQGPREEKGYTCVCPVCAHVLRMCLCGERGHAGRGEGRDRAKEPIFAPCWAPTANGLGSGHQTTFATAFATALLCIHEVALAALLVAMTCSVLSTASPAASFQLCPCVQE